MEAFEKQVVVSGTGWLLAGLLCLLLSMLQAPVCNCPNIPVNASPQQVAALCSCPSNNLSTELVAVLALAIGSWIIISRKRILEIRKRLLKDRHAA